MNNLEYKTRIIEKAIENGLNAESTKKYIDLLESTHYSRVLETPIGVFADATDNYKTIITRMGALGIKTIGDLVRYGGRAAREHPDIGVKTAALISDTLQEKFGIDNWFSKDKEE